MYLGIDVSKLTIDCCLISDGLFFERKFKNSQAGFQDLKDWLKENGATERLHCCCEATGKYYEAAAEYLSKYYRMSVENPRKIKGFGTAVLQRSKTDRQDAKTIAQYCKALEPRPWQKPTEAQTKLQELTRYQNRLKRQKAAEQTKLQTAPAYLLPLIQSTITHLQQQIKAVQNQLNQFHKDNPDYKIQKERLKTITGIGEAAANSLLSVLIQKDRFKSAAQFVAYIGLDPKENQSGTSLKGRPRISKLGNTHLRTTLFIPAMHAYRSSTFAKYVSRLQKNGKRPKVIIVALMRKLAVIAYYLIKTGQDFDNSRYE
ncbi:IS110 family transposase [Neisseria sp. P0006.S004]|uniref:IS110 family transposase n=1 Tax=unclassified Neisseria TaxID=2623750 RepID=UPI003F7DEDCE